MRNTIRYDNLIWVDITEPTEGDIKYLKYKFKLHPLTLKNIIPSIHHPDLDIFKNYISIILHHPDSQNNSDIQIQEIDIIAGKNYLITNHHQKIAPLNDLFDKCSKSKTRKKEYMEKGTAVLLFSILNAILKRTLEKLDEVEDELDSIEKKMFFQKEREMVKVISHLKRKVISFWRITEPQETVFYSLKIIGANFFGQEFKHYFSDLFRVYQRIDNALRTYKETIGSFEETNHILVNLKMNEIMKILTLFSVILMPLTLLASIWGMNTNFLPFIKNPFDFWLIIGIMAITFSGMIIYFKIKKWL
jgi:magnesium transporter